MSGQLPGWGTPITSRPERGQCCVCHRLDSVPEDERDRIPAFCSNACKTGWLELLDITSPATHVAEDDEWVSIPLDAATVAEDRQRVHDIADALRPLVSDTFARVEPHSPPCASFPEVDLVVAEAGPPVTPLTADELDACRRERPAPRPVPGAWLRDRLRGVFR